MSESQQTEEELRSRRRWRVRRRMAKTAFVAGLIYPILCGPWPHLVDLAIAFYGFVTGIIVVYIGGAVYEDTNRPGGPQ